MSDYYEDDAESIGWCCCGVSMLALLGIIVLIIYLT